MKKSLIISGDYMPNVLTEKDVLFGVTHQFLVQGEYLFQSETSLYFVMRFVKGGELQMIFHIEKVMSEEVVKFYAA